MTLSDDELLDFDREHMPNFVAADAERALAEHGDIYRAQLVAARWLDGWRERMDRGKDSPGNPKFDFQAGREDALRDIAAHLRQGHFLPGGVLYEDEVTGRQL